MLIAIDGPSGSGKSTVAKLLALKYDLRYIDTGAMYRAVTVMALRKKLDPNDEKSVLRALAKTKITFKNVKIGPASLVHNVFLNGENVNAEIRTNEVSSNVSFVARHQGVRNALVELQRRKAGRNAVLEGRDITTVVLPKADVKIFLEASQEARISRRKKDYEAIGERAGRPELENEITRRDKIDRTRKVSPLTLAPDAVHIDTTQIDVDKVISMIDRLVTKAREKPVI